MAIRKCINFIFLAKLGGWMGLVLGASMISVLEVLGFLYALIKIIIKCIIRRITKKDPCETPVEPIKY